MKGTIEMQMTYYRHIIFRDELSIIFMDICYLLVFKAFSSRGNTQCYCVLFVKKGSLKGIIQLNSHM